MIKHPYRDVLGPEGERIRLYIETDESGAVSFCMTLFFDTGAVHTVTRRYPMKCNVKAQRLVDNPSIEFLERGLATMRPELHFIEQLNGALSKATLIGQRSKSNECRLDNRNTNRFRRHGAGYKR